jgi:hypothetical protein
MTARIDVVGQRFGRLVVTGEGPRLHRTQAHPEGRRSATCLCDCGETSTVLVDNLRAGKQVSCGCYRREDVAARRPALKPVFPGDRYGRLVVLRETEKTAASFSLPTGRRVVVCQCDCGVQVPVVLRDLRRDATASCGCLARELSAARMTVHGMEKHPLYKSWYQMLQRCLNPASLAYPGYGGRGIRVCDRWLDVRVFVADIERWLGPRPEGMTLDRMQNDHDYRLDNVRWADYRQQRANQRTVQALTSKVMALEAELASLRAQLARAGMNSR